MIAPPGLDPVDPVQAEAVRALDPLRADAACLRLREMNARGDVHALVAGLRDLLPDPREVAAYSLNDCLAAMRDLGLFLGSIKRRGLEPAGHVVQVVPVLLELGRRTGMVPRDTVIHYTVWNPVGERQRMYTGDPQEAVLQDSVRIVFPHLRDGLQICSWLAGLEPRHPMFTTFTGQLTGHLESMVEAIDLVISRVSPSFFARTLRPYFEEITVAGGVYLGPAAAQVPLWLIDEVVWAADRGDPDYRDFIEGFVPYSLPAWRACHRHWRGRRSLVTRVLEGGADDAARALARLLRTVIVFRGRHLGLARQAYREEVRLYPVGSAGGSVELLRQVIELTRENARLVAPRIPLGTP